MQRTWSGGRWPLVLTLGVLALGAPRARADDESTEPPGHKWCIKRFKGEPFYGPNNRIHSFERAGYPCEVSKFAYPSETPNYAGYYVGGGCPCQGEGPGPLDGTYGWDYVSFWKHHYKVMLNWCHRYKGGYGRYKIDGPPVPDVGPYIAQIKEGPKAHHGHGEEHH